MQKMIPHCAIIVSLLLCGGCATIPGSREAAPESAQRLLKLRGYNFDEKSFFAAGQARDVMAINAFLDAGINPNAQDADGRTVLMAAAAHGDLDVVHTMLLRNVDLNVKDKRGYTALSHATEAMYEDVVDALLSHPDLDPNARGLNARPALLAYVWRDNPERVEKLLAHGADVNAQDADGDTALHGAAQTGNTAIMQRLLDKGADPNVKNKQGGTPLMWAAVYGHQDAARLLLSRGADAALKDNDGITAADWAARNKRENVVLLLRGKR
ncbi:MAG TPA: ankyrin repeat domain-containing protein [Pyrinomonadaceae bacterium]|nr:ankyrin repeat domain-containing protein [Pyrinomonadaceae bacterium]